MQPYSNLAREHFLNPRNVGDVHSPTATGRAGSVTCGAAVRVSLRIDEAQRIVDARFRSAGCVILVASASLLTEQIGKNNRRGSSAGAIAGVRGPGPSC
jgi:NifU-like protein